MGITIYSDVSAQTEIEAAQVNEEDVVVRFPERGMLGGVSVAMDRSGEVLPNLLQKANMGAVGSTLASIAQAVWPTAFVDGGLIHSTVSNTLGRTNAAAAQVPELSDIGSSLLKASDAGVRLEMSRMLNLITELGLNVGGEICHAN